MTKVIYVNTPQELDSLMSREMLIAPVFESIANENPDIVFLYVDIDRLSGHKVAAAILSVPSFHFYKNGNKVDMSVGIFWLFNYYKTLPTISNIIQTFQRNSTIILE
ncbi:hypothetical protein ACTA71_001584 [Dictyostelium dimigraforme]